MCFLQPVLHIAACALPSSDRMLLPNLQAQLTQFPIYTSMSALMRPHMKITACGEITLTGHLLSLVLA